jgi:lipopolysaccharide transport system permease protein
MSRIPERWQWVFALNPMSATVETARYAFLGAGEIRPLNIGISLGVTVLVLFAGIIMFSRVEKTFMDTV